MYRRQGKEDDDPYPQNDSDPPMNERVPRVPYKQIIISQSCRDYPVMHKNIQYIIEVNFKILY